MKTSNKLLAALLAVALLTLVGANVALKAEYDQIGFNDPYYGFSTKPVKPFRVLKLEGNLAGLIKVETGEVAAIRQPEDPWPAGTLTYQNHGDTLLVRFQTENPIDTTELRFHFDQSATVLVHAPTLQTLLTNKINCQLDQVKASQLTIIQQKAAVLLTNSVITNLTVVNQRGSELRVNPTNRVGTALVTARDSSAFSAERDVFGTLTLRTDSLAMVKVPGNLLRKVKP